MNPELLLIKIQTALMNRKAKKIKMCDNCGQKVTPLREISILNILVYAIIGVTLFLILKNMAWLLLPIGLSIVNSLLVKPKCPKCKSLKLRKLRDDE